MLRSNLQGMDMAALQYLVPLPSSFSPYQYGGERVLSGPVTALEAGA
jgi:hypothetical protein